VIVQYLWPIILMQCFYRHDNRCYLVSVGYVLGKGSLGYL